MLHEKEGRFARPRRMVTHRLRTEPRREPFPFAAGGFRTSAAPCTRTWELRPRQASAITRKPTRSITARRFWQQAKRLGEDPRDLKKIIQEAWTRSDSRAGFERALEQNALHLARGDKRGFRDRPSFRARR